MNARPDLPPRDFLRTRVTFLAVVALLIFGWMTWDAFRNVQLAEQQQPVAQRMQRVGSEMLDLGGVMTMTVGMAADSGDPDWEKRYLKAEPKLAKLIAEAGRLQPDAPAGSAAARIQAANEALVLIEHAAFDLIRQGKSAQARQLLYSEIREDQLERYAQGVAEFSALQAQSEDVVDEELIRSRRADALKTFAAIPLLVVILLMGVFLVFQAIRRWQALLVDSNRKMRRKAEELAEFNAQLDKKVGERTKQLSDSAMASLNMMEDAVRQREKAEHAQSRLNYLAFYDALTGLANQTLFLQRVQTSLRATRGDKMLLVFVLDIMRFKSVNDAYGWQAGDDLLKQIADRLVRVGGGDPDRFARVSTNRFAVVSTAMDNAEHAGRYAVERINASFRAPFNVAGNDVQVSVNVGIALFPLDGSDADSLLRNAEAALKKAKSSGELFLFFTPAMTERVAERLSLVHRLRQAVDNGEFLLHYQAKVSLVTGKVIGAEALLRWNDPATGLVLPSLFIPLLEENQMIQEVGRWAMRTAVDDYLNWRNQGMAAVPVAVNVSALQLRNRDFIEEVRQIVAIDARAAHGLELEITESVVMADIEHAAIALRQLRDMGVRIAIDDFGTGFSSLAYLSKLPIDTLKIDRAFVTDMAAGAQGIALVNAIITLAHSLQLNVVAEGVETDEQLRTLQSLRCDEMQGHLFSKPLPRELFASRYLTIAADA